MKLMVAKFSLFPPEEALFNRNSPLVDLEVGSSMDTVMLTTDPTLNWMKPNILSKMVNLYNFYLFFDIIIS
jgi:hypothetical protein